MLPRPDIVFQLDCDVEKILTRGGYGEEIYEKHEFQKKLREEYKFFHGYKYWKVIEALKNKEEINEEIVCHVENLIKDYENNDVKESDKNMYPGSISEDLFSIPGSI